MSVGDRGSTHPLESTEKVHESDANRTQYKTELLCVPVKHRWPQITEFHPRAKAACRTINFFMNLLPSAARFNSPLLTH